MGTHTSSVCIFSVIYELHIQVEPFFMQGLVSQSSAGGEFHVVPKLHTKQIALQPQTWGVRKTWAAVLTVLSHHLPILGLSPPSLPAVPACFWDAELLRPQSYTYTEVSSIIVPGKCG